MFCPDYRRGKLMDTRSVWQCWPPVDFNFLTFEFQFPIFPPGTPVYNDLWEMSKIEMSVSFFYTVSKIFRHFLSYLVFRMMFYDGCAWFFTIFRFSSKKKRHEFRNWPFPKKHRTADDYASATKLTKTTGGQQLQFYTIILHIPPVKAKVATELMDHPLRTYVRT